MWLHHITLITLAQLGDQTTSQRRLSDRHAQGKQCQVIQKNKNNKLNSYLTVQWAKKGVTSFRMALKMCEILKAFLPYIF